MKCDETVRPPYPLTALGARCPGVDFCAWNFEFSTDGKGCSQFDKCNAELGEGTGTFDFFGNVCPHLTSNWINQCTNGWPFDRDNAPCNQFDFIAANFDKDYGSEA